MKVSIFLLIILISYLIKEGYSKKKKKTRRCRKGYAANEPILVVISFDGFKTEYINSTYKTLQKLYNEGVKSEYRSLRFANSLNVHHTIATGWYPNKHGVFAHSWKDRNNYNVTYNRSQYENDIFRKNKVIPIWTLNELNGGTSACMMWPGCEFRYGPDSEIPIFHHAYNHTEEYKTRLEKVIEWMNESKTLNPPNLVMIYFNQPDYTAHRYGPNSSNVGGRITELDKFIEDFLAKLDILKLKKRVDFVFLSDHRVFEIHYKDIFEIENQGNNCTDIGLFGSDVWLQQLYYTRVSGNTSCCNGEYCRMQNCCMNPYKQTEFRWLHDYQINHHYDIRYGSHYCTKWSPDNDGDGDTYCNTYGFHDWRECELVFCYGNSEGANNVHGVHGEHHHPYHPRQYNISKCLKFIYERNIPQSSFLCPCPTYCKNSFNCTRNRPCARCEEIPDDLIANHTILYSKYEGHNFTLYMDSPITLSYKAFATTLYPKIRNWTKECPLEVTNCTPFGVHGYLPRDTGFFLAIGPSFIKNTTFYAKPKYEDWKFFAVDLYSCFARVLKMEGDFNNDGNFTRIKPVLNPELLEEGKKQINWLKQFIMIFICAVIHCIAFYFAANIYLVKRWVHNRKIIKKKNRKRTL